MMPVNHKQLSENRVWLDREGEPIKVDRCYAEVEKSLAERELDRTLLDHAKDDGQTRWFALRVENRREVSLRDQLIGQGVDAVVPFKEVHLAARRAGLRGKVIHKPVLRNLVFVNLVPSTMIFAWLLRRRGIEAVIGTGERPHPISDREMNNFMDLAQAGAFDERNTPTGLKVGSRVRIKVGAYADFEGVLEGYVGTRAARVMTYLFGREVIVDVKLAQIEKLD